MKNIKKVYLSILLLAGLNGFGTRSNAQHYDSQNCPETFRVKGSEITPCTGRFCDPSEKMSAKENAWSRADAICRPLRSARVTQWIFSNQGTEAEAGFICSLD